MRKFNLFFLRYEEREKMFSIRMGGLPYRKFVNPYAAFFLIISLLFGSVCNAGAREGEIQDWFKPEAVCSFVKILRSRKDNRPNGEAIAEFATKDDALNAMKKNKEYMGERFVILTPMNF